MAGRIRGRHGGDTKKSARRASAAILAAAALWGVSGIWNRRLMAAGLAPTSMVTLRNFGGMVLLGLVLAVRDRTVFRVKRREHMEYFFGTGVMSVVLFTACYFLPEYVHWQWPRRCCIRRRPLW
ncbi:MAG: hypothetical protein V8R40_14530 [Dysosmobacter sp.]